MKLKLIIFVSLLVLSLCTDQLFEVIEKEFSNKENIPEKKLFDTYNFVQKDSVFNKIPKEEDRQPSIFEEISEEPKRVPPVKIEKNNDKGETKFNAQKKTNECKEGECEGKNKKTSDCKERECHGKNKKEKSCKEGECEGKNKNARCENCKEVKAMEETITSLIEMNNKIMKRLKQLEKSKHPKEIVSFLQKHENEVNKLNNKLEKTNHNVKTEIEQKGEELRSFLNQSDSKYEELKNRLDSIDKEVTHNTHNYANAIRKLEQDLNTVQTNTQILNARVANIDKIKTNQVDLYGIKINGDTIAINNPNLKITYDGREISVQEIMEGYNSFQALQRLCGDNFERCHPIPEEEFKGEFEKQDMILDNLKKLKQKANTIIDQSKKRKFR
jgi:hypothetical protein